VPQRSREIPRDPSRPDWPGQPRAWPGTPRAPSSR